MTSDISLRIQELEAKIRELRSGELSELQAKLKAARQTVADLEAEIAAITGKAPAPAAAPLRRKRTNSEDVRANILKALSASPEGLSQKEISEAAGVNYNTVVLFLKKNPKNFKTTGARRSMRYFLK